MVEKNPLVELPEDWTSALAVDVTDYLEMGIESLKEQRVYIENLPVSFDPESFLRESAAATGKRFGCPFAVSFEVITI